MESVISKTQSISSEATKTQVKSKSNFWNDVETNRYGITPVILLVLACLGAITGASVMNGTTLQIAAVAFPSTISLAFILAVAPMRTITVGAVLAIVADIAVLLLS